MRLIAKILQLEADKPIVVLNASDAKELDVRPLDRVEIKTKKGRIVGIVNIAKKVIKEGEIGIYSDIREVISIENGDEVEVSQALPPKSIMGIKKKIAGLQLSAIEIKDIIEDVVKGNLSDIEITAFVTAMYNHGITLEEAANLSQYMAETGSMLKLKKKAIYDKHSIGGVPGDKTSILVVPIIAAAGLTIPKTSSRSITSPAGTADRFECLAPVEFGLEEIKRIVEKTNGCLVWGGALDLAPADDIFIRIEYPLGIDPFLLPSVMSKKKAVNARYVVIDIPTGKEAKIRSLFEFEELAEKFIRLGKMLGIDVNVVSTYGEQPIGHAIGPALEAREALSAIMYHNQPQDLIEKATTLASMLLNFSGIRNGKEHALNIIKSGKAETKLREIIKAQGGNEKIMPEDIPLGEKVIDIISNKSGKVLWISNRAVSTIAKEAGAPKNKGAGIYLHKKIGENVKKGEKIFTIYAEHTFKLNRALKLMKTLKVMEIGKGMEMLIKTMPREKEEDYFILER
ncbi:MAG: AMP phosphorylase [Candidatus Aenigmatarchaeota archaeon]|nr:MAG: AMP phosphorylase [Candidatus Aenigmarchaeota archaeon]